MERTIVVAWGCIVLCLCLAGPARLSSIMSVRQADNAAERRTRDGLLPGPLPRVGSGARRAGSATAVDRGYRVRAGGTIMQFAGFFPSRSPPTL
jgi:hypothetical protein